MSLFERHIIIITFFAGIANIWNQIMSEEKFQMQKYNFILRNGKI